jgi:hypothetical protein
LKLHFQGDEESIMRQNLKRQIRIVKGRRERRLRPDQNDGNGNGEPTATTTTAPGAAPPAPVSYSAVPAHLLAAIEEEEERTLQFSCRGLEHYFIPREQRRVQTALQRSTLQAVLDRQKWQRVQCGVGPMDEASSIARLFAEAARDSRADALKRAARDEAEARKIHAERAEDFLQ